MKYGSLVWSVVGSYVVLFAAGCGVSHTGLQAGDGAGAGGASGPPDTARAGGAGGRARPGSGGASGGAPAGAGGAGGTRANGTGGASAAPAPAADAAPTDDGRSMIASIDARPPEPVDGAAPPPPSPPPAGAKGSCGADPALRLCLAFEGAILDESAVRVAVTARQVSFNAGPTGMAAQVGAGSAVTIAEGASGLSGAAITLEVWVQPSQLPAAGQRAGLIDRDGHYGLFLLPGGEIGCSKNGMMVTADAGVRTGQWSSVACTANASEIVVWVNGARRGSGPSVSGAAGADTAPISVGSNSPSGDNLHGLIDNVRIWTRVRGEAEICQTALGCE